MLSRVAERLYWTARYLERAENTARLVAEANVEKLNAEGLHDFIDQLQLEFGNLHQQISSTWFSLELDEAV